MRYSSLFAASMAFILASAPASAALVVAIDDPLTEGIEFVIVDGGAFDGSPGTEGLITLNGNIGLDSIGAGGGLSISLSATNLLSEVAEGGPNLLLNVSSYSTSVPALDIWVSDTDLEIPEGTPAEVGALGEVVAGTISFEFWSDSANDPFGKGDIIDEFTEAEGPLGVFLETGEGLIDDGAGSVSIRVQTVLAQGESGPFNASYIASLTVVPVPPAVWLFGSALGLLGWVRRKAS